MLYFANKPDPAFAEMVDDTLELAADILSDADDDMIGTYPERIQGLSTAQTFLSEVEKLLDSHRSPGVFRLTDYHWLILHKLLNETVCEHNDGEFLFEELKIKEIDFDALLDIYFWDLDFLIPQGVFDAIPMEGKSQSGVSPETFGVIGGLKPHPSELELSAVEVCPEEWQVPDIYRPGEDYPFWPMRGEGE